MDSRVRGTPMVAKEGRHNLLVREPGHGVGHKGARRLTLPLETTL